MPTVDAKQQFLDVFRRERATTLKMDVMKRALTLITPFFLVAALVHGAGQPNPLLRLPGGATRPITPAALVGAGRMDVAIEGKDGDSIVYHGLPLLEVIEKAGVDTKTMASQRKNAPAIVVAKTRDGYTVVFSLGELLMHRSDPRVFLVSETAAGPLPENEGPVRLIVHGDRARSAYALSDVELRFVAQNAPTR